MKTTPILQVFCPVDPAELEQTPDGFVCRKCQQSLIDVSTPSGAKQARGGVCGVMRRMVGPVVGSSIALSACSTEPSVPMSDHTPEISSRGKDIPVPGQYIQPGGEPIKEYLYPLAELTDDPGIVISPYTQAKVDVSGIQAGTLVLDPAFKMHERKFFRVPAARNQAAQ